MPAVRIVLADDNRALLTELTAQLGEEFAIVGTAEDGEGTLTAVERAEPDVLILDISMPLLNGLQVAARLCENVRHPKIVFLTIHEQPTYISAAFSAGGSAYVTKRHLATDLVPAIRAVIDGQTFVSPSLRK